jgi:glycosyltransferase domain-containing protein
MKVAILIPTMSRRDFVERTVGYYNSLNSPHPIYLGDASDPEYAAQTAKMLKQFKNVEVNYYHWEGLSRTATLMRLAERAGREEQFCAYTGDDDYLVPSSLNKCVKFLSENKDYRTAQGRAAVIKLDEDGAFGNIKVLGQYWGNNSLDQEASIERIESFNKNYFVMMFSVHRINEFLRDGENFYEIKDSLIVDKPFLEIEESPCPELLYCYTIAIRGKSKFLNCLYMVRSQHPTPASTNSNPSIDLILNSSWCSDVEKFINALSISLHESSSLSLNQSKEVIKRLLENYLEQNFFHANESVIFLSFVKRCVPVGVKNFLRRLSTLIMDSEDMRLLRSKRSRFYEEFLPVCKSLKKRLT